MSHGTVCYLYSLHPDFYTSENIINIETYWGLFLLKSTCDVNLLSKLSIILKEWRVMNNVDRGGVIVLFIL
jgi:hypothetical protein